MAYGSFFGGGPPPGPFSGHEGNYPRVNNDGTMLDYITPAEVLSDIGALPALNYSAADVLAKILTVDGPGSGLDADLLDGQSSADFAAAGHTHTSSAVVHTPSGSISATDVQAAIDELDAEKAPLSSVWRLIEETSLTNVANYIRDGLSADFNFLRITGSFLPATDGAVLSLLFRKAGIDITAYDRGTLAINGTAVAASQGTAETSIAFTGGIENTAPNGGVYFEIVLNNLQSTTHKLGRLLSSFRRSTDQSIGIGFVGFFVSDASPITGLKLLWSSGNIASGRIRVEGC